jgi:phospholipid-translocating ATPase
MGILDQDVSDKVSLAVPQLYRRGIERKEWTQTKFWLYMLDGAYQSVMCYFMVYFLFAPANFETSNGLNINDTSRVGIFVASAVIVVVNAYVLMNTYKWDWLMVLLTTISILLIWFWTGVYTAFTGSEKFYKAAPQVYGQLSFWATLLVTVLVCLLPRFAVKAVQKVFMPYDVDIIREQVTLGRFKYLDDIAPDVLAPPKPPSDVSTEPSEPLKSVADAKPQPQYAQDDDRRPIYPPSVAPTATTHNNRSQNGSDGTDYTNHRFSMERQSRPLSETLEPPSRPISMERARPSYDRMRTSMDILRPSFEASRDLTSASQLARVESSHSDLPTTKRRIGRSNLCE